MPTIQTITPCLWFDNQAEEAARFYTAIFANSKIVSITRYGAAGHEVHGRPAGTVMTVAFELNGQAFTALNGGPMFKFNEASRSKSIAIRRKRWITIGRSSLKAEMKRRNSVAG
jgi:predicted 3-demethylubiquinone-9 3-methyltransferase (glyoxalase superfamily)